jgi:hypothetical protein
VVDDGEETDDEEHFDTITIIESDSSLFFEECDSFVGEEEVAGLESDSKKRIELLSIPNAKFSKAHPFYEANNVIFVSLDLETGGEHCGIVQLSAVFKNQEGVEVAPPFNHYVKPPDKAVWNPNAMKIHGLHKGDARIKDADSIEVVWEKSVTAAEAAVPEPKQGIIVAWNGKSCDMECIYRITQDEHHRNGGPLPFPENCDLFMDPYAVLSRYKGCHLSKKKLGVKDLMLTTIYRAIMQKELEDAHNSLADCKGQCDVIFCEKIKPYWDKPNSVDFVASLWIKKRETRAQAAAEPYTAT